MAPCSQLEKKFLFNKNNNLNRLDIEKRDQVSHFILRLAYCRTEELRKWFVFHFHHSFRSVYHCLCFLLLVSRFIQQECALLKYRLDYLSDLERERFMFENGLSFEVSN